MLRYSLDLVGPDAQYVSSHAFPDKMTVGERFEYHGSTYQVDEIATKQFNGGNEPPLTLVCHPV